MPGFNSAASATATASKGGGGLFGTGFSLPNLGVGELVRGFAGGLNSLYNASFGGMHAAADLLTGDTSKAGQDFVPAAALGKGMASSFLGTLLNAGDLVTGGLAQGATNAARDYIGEQLDHNNPQQYMPQTLMEEYNQGGILSPIVQNVGNVAAGAGILGKLATIGDLGTLGEAAATASRAAAGGFTAEDVANAAEAAKAGASGLRDAGIDNPLLTAAGKAAAKASDVPIGDITPEQIANRASWINHVNTVAHPYVSLFNEVLSPLGRAATASITNITNAPGESAVIDDAAKAAETPVEAPVTADMTGAHGGAPVDLAGAQRPNLGTQPGSTAVAPLPEGTLGVHSPLDELTAAMHAAVTASDQTPEQLTAEAAKVGQAAQEAKLAKAGVKPGEGVTMYQGRQGAFNPAVGTTGTAAGETPFWSDTLKEAQDHAGPGGHIVQVEVPKDVADAARAEGVKSGNFGTSGQGAHIVPPDWTANAVPTEYAGTAAHDLGAAVAEKAPKVEGETPGKITQAPKLTIQDALGRPVAAQPEINSLQSALEKAVADHMAAHGPEEGPIHLTTVGPEGGPVEQAIHRAATSPIPQWAQDMVAKMSHKDGTPSALVKALSMTDRFHSALASGKVLHERTMLQDINRREILQSPAFGDISKAAARELIGKTLPDGTIITAKNADGLIGDALIARLEHVSSVEDAVVRGASPTVMNQVRQALVRAGERSAQSIPDEWLHDAEGNRTVLGHIMDNSVESLRAVATQREQLFRNTSERGFEHISDMLPGLSPASQRAMRQMADNLATIRQLEHSKIPADQIKARAMIAAMTDQADKINIELKAAQAARKAAEDALDETRFPKNASEEYKAGESAGAKVARGEAPIKTSLGVEEQGMRTPAERLRATPDVVPQTPGEMYQRGVAGAQAAQRIKDAVAAETEIAARKVALDKNLADMKSTFLNHQLDSEQVRDRLAGRVQQSADRVSKELADPAMARVPPAFMPIWHSIVTLHKEAETNPELAKALTDGHVAQNWSTVLKIASEQGFNPVHIRSFSDGEVRHLVMDSVQLGKKGRDLGQNIVAGTRNARAGAATRTRSLMALQAGVIEATHEMHTNAVANFLHETYAKPVIGDKLIPGYAGWDAERSFLLTGKRDDMGNTVVNGMGAPQFQVPKEVIKVLRSAQADFNSPFFTGLKKVASPWKLLMLTLHPTWYINHMVGHIVLAAKEGVSIGDWLKSIKAFKDGHFNDGTYAGALTGGELENVLPVTRSAVAQPTGFKAAIKDAFTTGKRESTNTVFPGIAGAANARDAIAQKIARPATVVDQIARVATYIHGVRTGMTDVQALERTYKALVDFTDLSPFEREITKSLVPFYSFQKGMLKIVGRMPLDHPAVTAIMLELGKVNQALIEQQAGGPVPESQLEKVNVPGLGWISSKMLNPFMDAKTLTSPQEMFNTLNPFLKIGAINAAAPYVPTYAGAPTEINPYGTKVPTTSPGTDLTTLIGGLPQAKLVAGLAGTTVPGQYVKPGTPQPSLADTLAGFALPGSSSNASLVAAALKQKNGGVTPKAKKFKP